MTAAFSPGKSGGKRVFQAILAVDYSQAPGPLDVWIECADETKEAARFSVRVREADYASERIRVAKRYIVRGGRKSQFPGTIQPKREIQRILAQEKIWDGAFRLPVDSKITSPFGTRRIYNGRLQSYHAGVDFHALPGTAVHASARGRVILARSRFLTGNTVVLDHGYGIYTLYAHLSRILVKKGEVVDSNTVIARSGKTGRVKGAHLHWGASVHGVNVDPLELVHCLD